ncbi:MAG: hypothetical protein COB81_03805 [Flavobacteriaceae bacterium]|nr:MAG: hypothetical protein COB81_03805 [Flavobacteriaceae bacterium]
MQIRHHFLLSDRKFTIFEKRKRNIMKMKILAIAILCYAANSFAQNSDAYIEIELDGKKAWMHKTSGYVKYEHQAKTSTLKTQKNDAIKVNTTTSIYKVTDGDTYYSISNKHNISIAELLLWNDLSENHALHIGRTLKVSPQSSVKKTPLQTLKHSNTNQHTVTKGETLYSISRRYGIPVQSLLSKNNLNNTNISIGQKLTVQ